MSVLEELVKVPFLLLAVVFMFLFDPTSALTGIGWGTIIALLILVTHLVRIGKYIAS